MPDFEVITVDAAVGVPTGSSEVTNQSAQRTPIGWPATCLWQYCKCGVDLPAGERQSTCKPPGCAKPYPQCQICGPDAESAGVIDANLPFVHRVYHSFESACEIRDAWDALAATEGDLFCSFDWCALWWQRYGDQRQLEIHTFMKGDHLVGVAPLFRERLAVGPFSVRTVRIVGCDHSTTTCNLPLHPDFAEEVLRRLIDRLTQGRAWDLFHFGRLPGYFRYTDLLAKPLAAVGRFGSVETMRDQLPHTLIDLPKSFDEYLQGLSRRERHNIRKENRRLAAEHQLTSMDLAADGDARVGMERFIEFHQAQWTEKGQRGHFADWPASRSFHRDLALVERGMDRLSMRQVMADGQPLSMAYAIRFGRRVHWFLAARSMDRRWHFCFPGRVGACDLVKTAIEEGFSQVEIGIGYYPYKLKLGGRLYPVMHIAAVRAGIWPSVKVSLLRKIALLHELLGYRLWYTHIAPYLPFWHQGMARRWIRLRMWPADANRFVRKIQSIWHWPASLLVRALRRTREVQGVSGYWSLMLHQYRKFARRRYVVYIFDTVATAPSLDRPASFEVRRYSMPYEVDEQEKTAIEKFGGKFLWLQFEQDLQHGDDLWIGYLGGAIAGICWSTRPQNVDRYFVPLGEKDMVIRKCFTFPSCRNRGVYSSTLQYMIAALRAEGAERIFIDCRSWNGASCRGIEKAGFARMDHGKGP